MNCIQIALAVFGASFSQKSEVVERSTWRRYGVTWPLQTFGAWSLVEEVRPSSDVEISPTPCKYNIMPS